MSIYLGAGGGTKTLSDMKGPCPDGFHVPLPGEWYNIYNVGSNTIWAYGNGVNFSKYLKLPMTGRRLANRPDLNYNIGELGWYRSSSLATNNYARAKLLKFDSSSFSNPLEAEESCSTGCSVRAIKDSPVTPTSSWTSLYNDGYRTIYHNADLGLISITSYGTTYTIMDKNIGATTVYNYGDSITEANGGYYFQRGNNHGFPGPGGATPSPTSGSRVDTTGYGPGNYYDSSTWIAYAGGWIAAPGNFNLWGGQTHGTYTEPLTGIGDVYVGSTKVKGVYVGATKIYP